MKRRDCHRCDNFYECQHGGDVAASSGKKLEQYCLYCMGTPRVRKIGHKASWAGTTPKWCPLGRDLEGSCIQPMLEGGNNSQ